MKPEKVNVLGMELQRFKFKSCMADFAVDEKEKWASLYLILSKKQGKGDATKTLKRAKEYYEKKGFEVVGTVALSERMARIYKKVGIRELK